MKNELKIKEVMKNYQIYTINGWQFMRYDARKRIFRGIYRSEFDQAKEISVHRLSRKSVQCLDARCESLKVLDYCKRMRGTSHEKKIIEGGKHLWLASPVYKHQDYNKSIFSKNTETNRKRAALINAILSKSN